MTKIKVLFICTHNSARSQMAEEFLREYAPEIFDVQSAGMKAAKQVHPLVVEVMKEIGIDLSTKNPVTAFELYSTGKVWDFYISVCDVTIDEACPYDKENDERYNWPFPDPAKLEGSHEEKLAQTREIRDRIKKRIQKFADNFIKQKK